MAIDANYVSPNLRLAFAREDDPDADLTFEVRPADEVIPVQFIADAKWVVVATLTRPGKASISEWKEVPVQVKEFGKMVAFEMNPENYQKVCTMAAGRVLKRAGYPDRIQEFTALVTWRRRNRELELSLAGGKPIAAIGPAEGDKELAQVLGAAATADDDGIEDAEVGEETPPAPRPAPGASTTPAQTPQPASQPAAAPTGADTQEDRIVADLGLPTLLVNRYRVLPADLRAQAAVAIIDRVPMTGRQQATAKVKLVEALLRSFEAAAYEGHIVSLADAAVAASSTPAPRFLDSGGLPFGGEVQLTGAGAELAAELARQKAEKAATTDEAPAGADYAKLVGGFTDELLEAFCGKLVELNYEPELGFDNEGRPVITNLADIPLAALSEAREAAEPF